MQKPNVVIITIDECRASALSTFGNTNSVTPAAEYAANKGIAFNNCFVSHPKCVPSRCSLMSGRYVHTGGHRTLPGFELSASELSLPRILNEQNYRCGLFGKNHTLEEDAVPRFFHEYGRKYQSRASSKERDTTLHLHDPAWKAFFRGAWSDSFDDEHQDYYDVEQGLEFIRAHRSEPFFALFNLSLPHPVYYEMEPYISEIRRRDVPLPQVEPLQEAPDTLRHYRTSYGVEDLSEVERRRIAEAYLSMVSYVDNQVLRIYRELDDLGLTDETLTIYTSDHGDFAGDHGAYEKYDTLFYDCLVRVPLFMQFPGRLAAGKRVDGLVENVDILPTILELLGLDISPAIHGKSMLPYLQGEREVHKEYVFSEGGVERYAADNAPHYQSPECNRMLPNYYLKQKVLNENPETMYRAKMIRNRVWKFIYRINGAHELYHLIDDPGEFRNIYAPGHPVVARLMPEILRWSVETEPDTPPIEALFA